MIFRYKITKHLTDNDYSVVVQTYNTVKNKWKRFSKTTLITICQRITTDLKHLYSYQVGDDDIVRAIKSCGSMEDMMKKYICRLLKERKDKEAVLTSLEQASQYLRENVVGQWHEVEVLKENNND